MLKRVHIILYISVVLVIEERVGDDRQGSAISGFTSEDITTLLNSHNEYRRQAGSRNMRLLTWNTDLAGMAQGWVDQCKFGHNPDTKDRFGFRNVGENLYISGTDTYVAAEAVAHWNEEINYYDYATLNCTGVTCGHYTQVVWADSYELGCGIKWCSHINDINDENLQKGILIVCNYGPGGNFPGVKPYLSGTPCSECVAGATCDNKLCSGGEVPTTAAPGRQGADIDGFTPADISVILKKHNEYRRQSGSRNMRLLTWNTDLEGMAQGWVDQCKFGHNPDTKDRFGFRNVGENLYITGTDTYVAAEAIAHWYEEINDYDYDHLNCSAFSCGHYTQVVWADSYEVGCGIKWCFHISDIGKDLQQGILIVCNYGPAGNFPNTKPFKLGSACTECPIEAQICSDGLCAVSSLSNTTKSDVSRSTTSQFSTKSTTVLGTTTNYSGSVITTTIDTTVQFVSNPTVPRTELDLETQIIQTFVIFAFVAASVSVCFIFNTLRSRFSRKIEDANPKLSAI